MTSSLWRGTAVLAGALALGGAVVASAPAAARPACSGTAKAATDPLLGDPSAVVSFHCRFTFKSYTVLTSEGVDSESLPGTGNRTTSCTNPKGNAQTLGTIAICKPYGGRAQSVSGQAFTFSHGFGCHSKRPLHIKVTVTPVSRRQRPVSLAIAGPCRR